ncbi:MAG: acyl--CoA ligase [Bacteroidaceae bacterium]|nr:acyl--CoA ligase [Bacteroidaceae bacterium]
MSLEDSIEYFARLTPEKAAVITAGGTLSYAALWERIREKADALKLREGEPYAFPTTQDADFIVTYCAVHLCGGVAVPKSPRQQTPRPPLGGGTGETQAKKDLPLKGAGGSLVGGAILFTTGTTGTSKGVMVSGEAWTANAENLIDRLGFTSDLLFIICGPLNHLGCLSKVYPTLMCGATLYILESLKNLPAFFSVFSLPFLKFATFLVPSSIRMLLQVASKELAAVSRKIDFIETGAAAISQHDMERLCRLLPHSRLFNTYASTETGIICSYEYSRYGCEPGLLGKPMKHSSVRIGEGGRVICSGRTIMSGYAGSPEATAQVLRHGEVFTSDTGFIDDEGMLHLQGRLDDVINVGGYKVNPSEVEDAVAGFEPIADCICIPAPHILLGTVPKLLYVPRPGREAKPRDIADYLKGRIESYKIPLLYEAVEAIRRTYNGKPDRKAYT